MLFQISLFEMCIYQRFLNLKISFSIFFLIHIMSNLTLAYSKTHRIIQKKYKVPLPTLFTMHDILLAIYTKSFVVFSLISAMYIYMCRPILYISQKCSLNLVIVEDPKVYKQDPKYICHVKCFAKDWFS